MSKRWKLIERGGIGAFGYEIYEDTRENENTKLFGQRYLVKVYVYDKPILLSGDKRVLGNKLAELTEVFKKLQEKFPEPEDIL